MSGTDARWDHLSVAQRYRIYRAQRDLRDAYRDGRMPAREYVLRRDAAMVALACKYGISKQRVMQVFIHGHINYMKRVLA